MKVTKHTRTLSCPYCGTRDLKKVNVYEGFYGITSDSMPDLSKAPVPGYRCSTCHQGFTEAGARIQDKIEFDAPCCERLDAKNIEDGVKEGIYYRVVGASLLWAVGSDGFMVLEDIEYCPFCGRNLPGELRHEGH